MQVSDFFQTDSHWREIDRQMMSRALKLAKKGQYTARPNPVVGCVITNENGEVVGQGWHKTFGQAHAEINALEQAKIHAQNATCYVTLEPCAHTGKTGPCAEALVKAGVKKVIAAMADPNPQVSGKGFQILKNAGIEVEYGLMEADAKALNPGFISQMTQKRPFITCKLAMSLDGRTALENGESKWITGKAARADVQKLRAKQDAILTGAGTVLADDPSLTVRREDSLPELDDWFDVAQESGFSQPSRVLLDRSGKVDSKSKIFAQNAKVTWYAEQNSSCMNHANLSSENVEIKNTPRDLQTLVAELSKNGCSNLLVEAGHKLAGAFLRENLIDKLVVYMAPKLMGNKGMGLINLEVEAMADAVELELIDIRLLGDDIRLTYKVL